MVVFMEKNMLVCILKLSVVNCVSNFCEVIHIELPNEGVVVAMLKVLWKHLFAESSQIKDDKGILVLGPPHNIFTFLILS